MKGFKVLIKYVDIDKNDYVIAYSLENVEGFNFNTDDGTKKFINKVELVSGNKVESLVYSKKPEDLMSIGIYPLSVYAEALAGN